VQLEEKSRESRAKDGYIDELLLAFETAQAEEKENDNSTLDNDSERDSEFALPEWLEPLETQEHQPTVPEEEEESAVCP
jgi:hypothetical protein